MAEALAGLEVGLGWCAGDSGIQVPGAWSGRRSQTPGGLIPWPLY